MLAEFFTWWRQHLLELVPEALRQRAGGDGAAIVAELEPGGMLALRRRRRGAETALARVRLDEPGLPALRAQLAARPAGEKLVLRLPPGTALERPVSLPLAAERDLDRVLTYDMERLTPFTAEEVFWSATAPARDKARGKIGVRLTIVPRAAVQALIEALTLAGARPAALEAPVADGARLIRLQHGETAARIARLSPRMAGIVLAALAALALTSPFLRQSLEMAQAQRALDDLAPRMRLVEAMRRRIAGAGAGGEAVARESRRLGDVMGALAAITDVLPDDSYLTEFSMRERKITLSGLSASAPRLISGLSADGRVRNPAFTAPVTKAEQTQAHLDVFQIRADYAE